jgi:hypothetical protein
MGTTPNDQQRDEIALVAPINVAIEDGRKSFRFSITNSVTAFGPIDAGRYEVRIENGTAAQWMEYVTAPSASSPAVTSPDASGKVTGELFGDEIKTMRIGATNPYLWAKTGAGTFTLHMIAVN